MKTDLPLSRLLTTPTDSSRSVRARGLLADFNTSGVLTTADVQAGDAFVRIATGNGPDRDDEAVALAAALCVRALRHGSIAISLEAAQRTENMTDDGTAVAELPWPEFDFWARALSDSPAVAVGESGGENRPLRWAGERLYLQKYWQRETAIRDQLVERLLHPPPPLDPQAARTALELLFPGGAPDRQRLAVATALAGHLTILAGGPGTGKTTTIAGIVAALRHTHSHDVRIALTAPTGKAAARLQQATTATLQRWFPAGGRLGSPILATTLHRLLGAAANPSRPFRHDRHSPLTAEVVVIDECSMVDINLMGSLLDAMRPAARLVLVGDPDQLAAIDAGAVLGDLVAVHAPLAGARAELLRAIAPAEPVDEVSGCGTVVLSRGHRFTGTIAALATAIGSGDVPKVLELLTGQHPDLEFVQWTPEDGTETLSRLRSDVIETTTAIRDAARSGDARAALSALDSHRLLCAHRAGPFGVAHWNDVVSAWVGGSANTDDPWPVGQGVIVTANDYRTGLYNGDAGVIVVGPDGRRAAAFDRPEAPLLVSPTRLDAIMNMDAMTIHRGQGSQFDAVTVILPEVESPLLTRELLYTAVTRARRRVRIVARPEAVEAAVQRRVVRASGLTDRLTAALTARP